jgi:HNH endonuclease
MNKELDQEVRRRAGGCCEYCGLPQAAYRFRFPIDHIIALQHGGSTVLENLALACVRCNRHKGPNLTGIDPVTNSLVRLFNPRTDTWDDHFQWLAAELFGLTPTGRATIRVLSINDPNAIAVRQALIAEGAFPPSQSAN